jgi:ferric-dicitrate binding protein FerR (iron transport regulator)
VRALGLGRQGQGRGAVVPRAVVELAPEGGAGLRAERERRRRGRRLLALGGAAVTPGTFVNEVADFSRGLQLTALTPVGERRIGVEVSPGGSYLTVDTTVTLTTSIEAGVRR